MDEEVDVVRQRATSLVCEQQALMRSLVAMREAHGLSQEEVAYRMGVTQPAVSKFERYDSNPTLSTVRRYALSVGARLHLEVVDDVTPPVGGLTARLGLAMPRHEAQRTEVDWGAGLREASLV